MGLDDIIELVILLIFFIVSPLLRQWRQRQQKKDGDVETPSGPAQPSGPAGPRPGWPAEPAAQRPANYAAYLLESLNGVKGQAEQALRLASQSPLLELPALAPVAEQLVGRTRREVEAVRSITTAAIESDEPGPVKALRISRAIEEARLPLNRARAAQQLLGELTSQRTDPRSLRNLRVLDKLIDALTRGRSDTRRRFAFLSDYDPRYVAELIGPGEVGLVVLSPSMNRHASGWAQLARGVGFDLLGEFEGSIAELREAAMVGRLRGKQANPPYFATGTIDMANAVGAWIPALFADAAGAHLLGRPYALAVVQMATARGVSPLKTVTVETESGRYSAYPPLLFRLTVIDAVLDLEGRTEAENGVGALKNRMELPQESRYALPNGLTVRMMLTPIIEYMHSLGQLFQSWNLAAAGDRRLPDLVDSGAHSIDRARVETAKRGFFDDANPVGAPVTLLAGAVLAEYEDESTNSYLRQLVQSLLTPPRRRPVALAQGQRAPARLLFRDALVLSEIL